MTEQPTTQPARSWSAHPGIDGPIPPAEPYQPRPRTHPPIVVHRSAVEFADRITRMEWAATPPATDDQVAAFQAVDDAIRRQVARAIGWFRR